ncbi:ATP-dependent DNA helicase PIF1 [Mycena chlorophos]|uniref:ATP-dependent DNA helicase n=1 Tax=Mycena chlorophos TaxID=658473 RepID=A0A8H6WE98_MYCCL|nr:ATP-dependent DNA helicase PIF1 [Mycena chlorophos]
MPGKKRKSEGDAAASKRPAKQPRRTLDSFFSPQVLAPASSAQDDDRRMVSLNFEQTAILRQVVNEGKNVFFTGSAGTGKSLLLRAIITALKKKHGKTNDSVSVTASTGMAASNIGGMTLHAWGAISPTPTNFELQVSCIRKCRPALQRWQKTKVLIIDEVSMVDGPLFTRICKLAETLRKSDAPFGGIQLVITGDFFQLPPVSKNGAAVFAFESDEWRRCIHHTLSLSQVFRQKDDEFATLLNELRLGNITPAASATFRSLSRPLPPDPAGILPTELFPMRNEVDRANSLRQSYVALSRAASMSGLQVLRFDANKVKAHPKVVEWSKTLETRCERTQLEAKPKPNAEASSSSLPAEKEEEETRTLPSSLEES